MSNKIICPFCGTRMTKIAGELYDSFGCQNDECHYKYGWISEAVLQILIQSRQQLKMLEPIVAELQGRADINAEVARDSCDLVVQWYEKYEQSQKDLEIARNALEELRGIRCLPAQTPWEIIADKALEQIEHKE